MKLSRRLIILPVLSLLVIFPMTALLCGTERWNVKVCSDAQARVLFQNGNIASHQLNATKTTTIDTLTHMTVPGPLGLHTPRFTGSEAETNIWEIEGTLIEYKWENGASGDSDYHLVIRDSQGNTLVAEIPNPNCLGHTPQPLRSDITQARHDFDAKFSGTAHASGTFKFTTTKVKITGQGFFDRPHASASATNGIEIHPIIKIEFQ
jgi:hypothetical protein